MDLNAASFKLTAVDDTAAGINSVTKRLEAVKGSVAGLGASIGALAAAAGVGFFAHMIESTISANAELARMAEKTGASVESLSALKGIAKTVGADFDAVATAIGKLDKAMFEAATKGGQAATVFAGLGVSVKTAAGQLREPNDVLMDVALALEQVDDAALKSALAQEVFGKAGIQMLPVLKELAIVGEFQAKVTEEQAARAEDLERTWTKLGSAGKGFWQTLVNELTPALEVLSHAILDTLSKGGGLRGWAEEMAADHSLRDWAMAAVEGFGVMIDKVMNLWEIMKLVWHEISDSVIGQAIRDIGAAFGTLFNWLGNAIPAFVGAIAKVAPTVGTFADQVKAIWAKSDVQNSMIAWRAELGLIDGKVQHAGATVRDFGQAGKEAADNFGPLISLLDTLGKDSAKLDAELASLRQYGIATKETALAAAQFEVTHGKISTVLAQIAAVSPAAADAYKRWVLQLAAGKDALQANVDLEKQFIENTKKWADGLASSVEAVEKELDAEKRRNAEFGLTRAQVIGLTIAEEQRRLTVLQETDADALSIQVAKDRIGALQQLQTEVSKGDTLHVQLDLWQQIDQYGKQVWDNLWTEGRSSLQKIGDMLKKTIVDLLYQLTVKQWILNIGANVSGNPGVAGLASQAGSSAFSGLGNTGLSSLLGGNGGGGGLYGLLSGAGASGTSVIGADVAGGAAGAFDMFGAAAPSAAGLAIGEGAGATLMAAIPYVGWAIAAAAAIYSIVQSNKKPSPVSGQFGISGGTGGFEDNAFTSSAFGNIGFRDSGTQQFSGAAGQALNQSVAGILDLIAQRMDSGQIERTRSALQSTNFSQMTGTFTTEDFLAKYGTQVLKQVVGTALNELDPALAAVLAQFQGLDKDLPNFISGLLQLHDITAKLPREVGDNLVHALDGTVDALTRVTQVATAILTVQDLMNRNPLDDALAAVSAQSQTAYSVFLNQASALRTVIDSFDHTAAGAQRLASATVDYYNAQIKLLAQIEQVKSSINAMFGDTIRNLTLQSLNNDKPGQYAFLQNEADRLRAQILTTSDPDTIRSLSERINQDINQAFGLLDDGQRQGMLGDFTASVQALNDLVQNRLGDLSATTTQSVADTMTEVRDALATFASDMRANMATQLQAAQTQQTAADTSLAAAETPIQIIFTSNVPGTTETNLG